MSLLRKNGPIYKLKHQKKKYMKIGMKTIRKLLFLDQNRYLKNAMINQGNIPEVNC